MTLAPAVTDTSLERIRQAQDVVKHGTFSELCDLLLYADAFIAVAREKRAAEAAREAARIRIEAARRLGQIVEQTKDDDAKEKLWAVIPARFMRCDEIARIPQRLFNNTIEELLHKDSACTIPSVIRAARIKSLTNIEPEIYQAYDQTLWIKPRGTQTAIHISYGGIEAARRKLGLRKHPHATKIDDAYSTSRILANQISNLKTQTTTNVRELLDRAELKQAEVAELLDQAIKATVNNP